MWRLILLILFVTALYYVLRFLMENVPSTRKKATRHDEPEELIQDPCCKTYVPKRSAVKKRIAGKDYYFCNPECLTKYLEKS